MFLFFQNFSIPTLFLTIMRLFLNFYLLLTFYFIQIPSIASQSTRLNHAHLIAENNQTSLYKLFVESIKTVQKGFETKLVTLFQPVHKFCKTADKVRFTIVVLLYISIALVLFG